MGRERAEGVSRRCGMKSRGSDGRAGAARVEVPEAQTNQARVSLAAAPPLQSHRENFSLVQQMSVSSGDLQEKNNIWLGLHCTSHFPVSSQLNPVTIVGLSWEIAYTGIKLFIEYAAS